MKNPFILSLIFIIITSCTNDRNNRTDAIDFVPDNTKVVLKIQSVEAFDNDLNNNVIIAKFSLGKTKDLQPSLSLLKHLKTDQEVVIVLGEPDSLFSNSYQLITRYNDSLGINDSINFKSIETLSYRQHSIAKHSIDNDTIYSVVVDSFFVVSNNKKQLENMIIETKPNKSFVSLKQLRSDASLSLYMASDYKDSIASTLHLLGNKTMLDVDLSQDLLSVSGITKFHDSIPRIINYLGNTQAKENKLVTVIPGDSKQFVSYTFHDFNEVISNYKAINQLTADGENADINDLIIEIGEFDINDHRALALRSIDIEAVNESINSSFIETYRQVAINELDTIANWKLIFRSFSDGQKAKHAFIIEDFMIFTESVADAQKIIASYTNKSTLKNSAVYKNVQDNISDESSVLYFNLSSRLDSIITNNLPKELTHGLLNNDLKKDHAQLVQVINDHGFAHVNMIVQESKGRAQSNSVSEEFNISLDNDLLNDPQVVKNHITGQMDIVVQDVENNLYLISNRGKIQWKKKINGNILGKVEQIDIYKNGRLQLIFATPNEIYVLDRNGKNVSPFPITFKDEITQPLSVFDYDKNKNYRIFMVQGKNALMYNTKGKIVKGFTFKSSSNSIITQPKHFRVGNKDYIIFGAGKKMYILNRKGRTRVTAKESIDFSSNGIYLYKNNFTTTNTKGQLVQVDQKGRVSKLNLMLPIDHDFSATSKTLTVLADNKLTIKSKSIDLDFGEYTAPKIFYLKDKIYVSLTDLQTQKTYLFDSQAKLLPNYPVYGNSSIVLDNLDKDRKLEFVVKGDSNTIILYQVN